MNEPMRSEDSEIDSKSVGFRRSWVKVTERIFQIVF